MNGRQNSIQVPVVIYFAFIGWA